MQRSMIPNTQIFWVSFPGNDYTFNRNSSGGSTRAGCGCCDRFSRCWDILVGSWADLVHTRFESLKKHATAIHVLFFSSPHFLELVNKNACIELQGPETRAMSFQQIKSVLSKNMARASKQDWSTWDCQSKHLRLEKKWKLHHQSLLEIPVTVGSISKFCDSGNWG